MDKETRPREHGPSPAADRDLTGEIRALAEERDALEQELYELNRYVAFLAYQSHTRVNELLGSTSWRVTAPLRAFSTMGRRVIGSLRARLRTLYRRLRG